jgi:Protein of unknown function (DUF3175)
MPRAHAPIAARGACILNRPMSTAVNRRKRHARAAGKKTAKPAPKRTAKKWSGAVSRKSDALDLEQSIFKSGSAARIAHSLKKSAESSRRRKAGPYQSAMSMLNFYMNRGGSNLSPARKRVLQQAKDELRKAFHRAG